MFFASKNYRRLSLQQNKNLIPAWDKLPALSWKNKVAYLTYEAMKHEQRECPLEHIFEPGMYIREMRIPAGTLFTGREHLKGHECQLNEGEVILVAPDGKHHFTAFSTITSKPGFHAVAYAITDIVSRTLHPNPDELRDTDALEAIWFGTAKDLIDRGAKVYQNMLELRTAELASCQPS